MLIACWSVPVAFPGVRWVSLPNLYFPSGILSTNGAATRIVFLVAGQEATWPELGPEPVAVVGDAIVRRFVNFHSSYWQQGTEAFR